MDRSKSLLFAVLFFVAIQYGVSGTATVPAFLWSSHQSGSHHDSKDFVDYKILSPKELASSVLSEGGWSKFLCPAEDLQHNVDIALVFVGKKLKSSDVSRQSNADTALVDHLKHYVSSSNFSMAFPYIATQDDKTLENTLVSNFVENCGHGLKSIALSDACSVDHEGVLKLDNLQSIQEYLSSKVQTSKQTDLVVFCSKDYEMSEGKIFSDLMSFLKKLGVRYSVLYASDPFKALQHSFHNHMGLDRFLAEGSHGNASLDSTHCDGICRTKSALLEGVFVGIVLLIILLSGLCCMAGIDTPTRFETPQES